LLDFDTGYWILDTGFWILDTGFWILDTGFWILDTGLASGEMDTGLDVDVFVQNYFF
jgi:hypothetical protein